MAYAVLFPGQGSQFVGMGADLFDVRPDLLGETADEILGFSLRSVCLEGSAEELTRTEHSQPALFAVAYALWSEFSREAPVPAAAAGHSLGEYTALTAAGAFDYEVALGIVAERSRAMAAAADVRPGSMAALIGAEVETAEAACARRRQEGGHLWVAITNAPGQVVVAGGRDDIDWLAETAPDLGIRRVVPLAVAGAFHTPFMMPAADRLMDVLDGGAAEPAFPVYANVTAAPLAVETVVSTLIAQVVSPVRFAESLEAMAATGIDTFVHIGPGDVTAGLAKRTVPGATTLVVASLEDVGEAADTLSTMQ